jgi:hypothetical protein
MSALASSPALQLQAEAARLLEAAEATAFAEIQVSLEALGCGLHYAIVGHPLEGDHDWEFSIIYGANYKEIPWERQEELNQGLIGVVDLALAPTIRTLHEQYTEFDEFKLTMEQGTLTIKPQPIYHD